MRGNVKRFFQISVFIAVAALAVWGANRAVTPPFVDANGRILPKSIATLEKLNIGGVGQYVLIRGEDVSNPVVLFLHGGPGVPLMFLAHKFEQPLEKHFVVVQWDRRGAGKSYDRDTPPETINAEQELADTRELIDMLRERFHQDKVYLIGHSYGSYLGVIAAQRMPERLRAYIGVGQEACTAETENQIEDRWFREMALRTGNYEVLDELDGLRPLDRDRLLFEFGGEIHSARSWTSLLNIALGAQEYSVLDLLKIREGINSSERYIPYNTIHNALMDAVPEVHVPVYFFTGRYDYTVPFECTERYYRRLIAPAKQMVWFDNSAHFAFLEEPEKFALEMDKVAAATGR